MFAVNNAMPVSIDWYNSHLKSLLKTEVSTSYGHEMENGT